MFLKLKSRIKVELADYVRSVDKLYSLKKISPVLSRHIKDFISRKGKRIRPIFFLIGYLSFSKKTAPGLYRSAISIELLHDFLLVHDDIIDKSDLRRGKPAMHTMLNNYLKKYKNIKFNGQDLAIVIGDTLYAMAIQSFLAVKEDRKRKEEALKIFIETALRTTGGEFIELLAGIKNIDKITKPDIYRIYDLKTGNYTFASPLAIGATLAGAKTNDIKKLFEYGLYLGRAFQIKDDIIGLFGEEEKIGKSTLSDLQEAKKTILIWRAYHCADRKGKLTIKKIFSKNKVNKRDLLKMRRLISETGSLSYAKKEISTCVNIAQNRLASVKIPPQYKKLLLGYSQGLINDN
ncbi:MAG: polyprenyl synthetase family protein [bacterium]|nr:polyprenyl synthetase family protein [bacterium]